MRVIIGAQASVFVLLFAGATASAQTEPKFKFGDKPKEEVSEIEWTAQAQAGLVFATGNTEQTVLTGGAKSARKAGFNKFQAELVGNFARTNLFVVNDANGNGRIDDQSEVEEQTQTTAQALELKARYDRFLSDNNSLYLALAVGTDKAAGKELVGGGQVGYSRQLVKNKKHELLAETGYDLSYEKLEAVDDAVAIHSGRLFFGYTGKLSETSGVTASTELLLNFNEQSTAAGQVEPLEDARFTGKVELTTKLLDDISLNLSFVAKYDNAPAPRGLGLPFADGFVILADELDTTTKATVIINFL